MATPHKSTAFDDDSPKQAQRNLRSKAWILSFFLPTMLNDASLKRDYASNSTQDDPFIVDYLANDSQDALKFPKGRKWTIALSQAMSFFAVTFGSSVYVSAIPKVMERFRVVQEVAILGLALYVLGFAIGPILWAPTSEVYGRKFTFMVSYTVYVAFTVAAPFAPDITALLLFRFLASAFGSSAQTNPGGMIADMFNLEERAPVMGIFAAAPFLGPALGPIVGGFVAENSGWRWTLGVNAILSGTVWITAMLVVTETYAQVILRFRAKALSRMTGRVHVSRLDAGKPRITITKELSISLIRPWLMFFQEPIVMLTALYISIIYATLYMFVAAIPIVFEGTRGWDEGVAGLPFVGVTVGVMLAVGAAGMDNKRYKRLATAALVAGQPLEPEVRLHNAMIGSIVLPVGVFLFAWTTYPSINWIAPVIGATIFSCGLVIVFISLLSYLVDCYSFYVASAIAANTILRSFLATALPLFTTQMYASLGDQWASSIPAFLVVCCLPFPFLFYRYGSKIRLKCKYAAEASKVQDLMRRRRHVAADTGA